MSKRVALIAAGLLLAAGTVAAISAPHFRGGGHMRGSFDGPMFDERGDLFGGSSMRLGERLKELDANKDGAITLEEFVAPRDTTFVRFDKSGDGVIERAEFEAFAKESADYWVKRFIKRFDADNDGRISKDEFAKARHERFAMRDLDGDGRIGLEDMGPGTRERFREWRERSRDRRESRVDGKEAGRDGNADEVEKGERHSFDLRRLTGGIDRRFNRMDKNGDGFIDAKDLEPAAAERVAFASKRFFRRFDADADGKVARDEFNRFAKERFASLDLDGDGRITDADLPPMMRGRGLLK